MRARWTLLCVLAVPAVGAAFVACGTKNRTLDNGGDDASSSGSGLEPDSGVSGSSGGSSSGGIPGTFQTQDGGGIGIMTAPSPCKAGYYRGSFTGSYESSLILGIPLSVTGDVNLTLNQAGTAMMMCKVEGEGLVTSCSNVFSVSGGTVTGRADQLGMLGDAAIGGFPYFCTLTGTLDCATRKLVDGWIQCTYCVGDLTEGGTNCTLIGGHFAGPVTADYYYGMDGGPAPTFGSDAAPGLWNGAESLAGNNGMMPGPDGGAISDYLRPDGSYGFGAYGGNGTWTATLQ
jgi:hypothetical protein